MEESYLELLRYVRHHWCQKAQRAVLKSTGKRPAVRSVVGKQVSGYLYNRFPLLTTKRMPWKAVVGELLWFLSGSTNVNDLRARGVTIWDEWAGPDGELGPVYGKQWRRFEGPQGPVDQVANLVANIKAVVADPHHPAARRLLLTSWHPADMPDPKVPTGCHTLAQWHVTEGFLDCTVYQRSADMFLGVPFNIASYALLTCLLAAEVGLKPDRYVHTFGDAHVYENHFDAVDEQLTREPKELPRLKIDGPVDVLNVQPEQIQLLDYDPHGPLKAEVAV